MRAGSSRSLPERAVPIEEAGELAARDRPRLKEPGQDLASSSRLADRYRRLGVNEHGRVQPRKERDRAEGMTGLNYASDYQDVDGINVPAKRRIYAYEGDYQLVKEPLLVATDFTDIKVV